MRPLALLPFAFALVLVAACDSEEAAAPVGVNDVRKACDIRVSWSKGTTPACNECLAIAGSPACDCPDLARDYAGKCNPHRDAKAADASCYDLDVCAKNCAATDCGCVESCWAANARCRELASALDGCLAEMCQSTCQ